MIVVVVVVVPATDDGTGRRLCSLQSLCCFYPAVQWSWSLQPISHDDDGNDDDGSGKDDDGSGVTIQQSLIVSMPSFKLAWLMPLPCLPP